MEQMHSSGPKRKIKNLVETQSKSRYTGQEAPVAQLDRALPSEGRGQRFESSRVHHLISKLISISIIYRVDGYFYPPNYPPYVFGFWPTLALNNFLCNARPHARQCVLVSTEALVRIAGWGLSVRIFDASAC